MKNTQTACVSGTTVVTCQNGSFVNPSPCGTGNICRDGKCLALKPSPSPTPSPTPTLAPNPSGPASLETLAVGLAANVPPNTAVNPSTLSSLSNLGITALGVFGSSSCSSFNRYSAAGCLACPSGAASCCGSVIPQTAKVCPPFSHTCNSGTSLSLCNSEGTSATTVQCAVGMGCVNGQCLDNHHCPVNSCIAKKWCGSDGELTNIDCNTGKSCGSVADGKCGPSSQRCINGQLYNATECANVAVASLPSAPGSCFFGVSTCSSLGRYQAGSCSVCPSGAASCCGDIIPKSAQKCTPGARTCASDVMLESCSLDGTTITDIPCAQGLTCSGNRCVSNVCKASTCVGNSWCGEDGIPTSIVCGKGAACGKVQDGACSNEGNRCINGVLYPASDCAVKPAPIVNAGQCFYGSSSCSALNRYPSATACTACTSSFASCCGDLIPVTARICVPGANSCTNNRIQVCNSTGTGYVYQNCAAGSACQNGPNQACVAAANTCTCTVGTSSGGTTQIRVNEKRTSGSNCWVCLGTKKTCLLTQACETTAAAVAPGDESILKSIQSEYPDLTILGQGGQLGVDELLPFQNALSLIPRTLNTGLTYLVGNPNTGGGLESGSGASNSTAFVGSAGCSPENKYTQNKDIACGYAQSIVIHETLHSYRDTPDCENGFQAGFLCLTVQERFTQVSKQDGVTFQSDTSQKSYAPGSDFLLYSQYPTNADEGFAISGAAYVLAPDKLKEEQPNVYDFYRTTIFQGQEYTQIRSGDCLTATAVIKNQANLSLKKQHDAACAAKGR